MREPMSPTPTPARADAAPGVRGVGLTPRIASARTAARAAAFSAAASAAGETLRAGGAPRA